VPRKEGMMRLVNFGYRTGHGKDEGVLTATAGIRTKNPILVWLCTIYLKMLGYTEVERKEK